jgi:hypothetical protein
MEAFLELFTTQVGLLSVFTIAFVIVMAVFFVRYFSDRISEDERRAAKQQQRKQSAKA